MMPRPAAIFCIVVAVERYDRAGTTDFYPQLNKLKGLKPDALIWGYTDESGKLIIRQALEVAGPKRLLFGSDSSFFPRGWHYQIFEEQATALYELGLDEAGARAIFRENLMRILAA